MLIRLPDRHLSHLASSYRISAQTRQYREPSSGERLLARAAFLRTLVRTGVAATLYTVLWMAAVAGEHVSFSMEIVNARWPAGWTTMREDSDGRV